MSFVSARCANAVLMGFLLAASPVIAADAVAWKTRFPAEASIGALKLAGAQFEIACRGGKRGAISFALVLPDPAPGKDFPLDAFEGPDGVGETRALAQWSTGDDVKGPASRISGWYGVDGDGYLLSSAREAARPAELAAIARHLGASDRVELRFDLQRPQGNGAALQARAWVVGRRSELERLLRPCLATGA